jgi:hypothetical protein
VREQAKNEKQKAKKSDLLLDFGLKKNRE